MPHLRLSTAFGSLALLCASIASAQSSFLVGNGAATIPASGTGGGGSWPSTLPANPAVSYSSVSVPADGCRFTRLLIAGLTHTWVGDLQIVLQSPTGRTYNIVHRVGFDGSNAGSSGDASNVTLEFVPSSQWGAPSLPTSGPWSSGVYKQTYGQSLGVWPSGVNGIENIPLELIGVESGLWSLRIYDWSAGDTGQIFGWTLEGVRGIPARYTGSGSPIPAMGSGGGGTWPGTLPPSPASTFSIYAPASFVKVTKVSIEGLAHSYVGDLQITLRPPDSARATNLVHRPGFTGTGNGSSGDCLGGGYAFIAQTAAPSTYPPASGNWNAGQYWQFYGSGGGTWPSGTNQIDNHSIESLRAAEGSWQLQIYDWAGGDVGAFSSWSLDGYYLPTGPLTYCTAGTSTNGCVPTLTANGTPSQAMLWPSTVFAVGIEGQKSGMIFYGTQGKSALPWGSSTLCVKAPTQRSSPTNSGGTINTCGGMLLLDWNAFRNLNPTALGQPFVPGECVFLQGWYRDPPSPKGNNLTNGLELTHLP